MTKICNSYTSFPKTDISREMVALIGWHIMGINRTLAAFDVVIQLDTYYEREKLTQV